MIQLGRAIALCFLSAVTAEFLLGDQWLTGAASPLAQLPTLILYLAFYGSAAVLIRELARRTGRGWPTILLLALAFGVIEEGIVDESLFNPNFAGEHLLQFGFIPDLGIGGPWTIFVLSLHVIWSIGAPIAVAEALFPAPLAGRVAVAPQSQARWLGTPGVVIASVLYVFGAAAIFFGTVVLGGFLASPWQLVASAVIAAVLIVIAVRLPRRSRRAATNPFLGLLVGGILTSVYVLLEHGFVLNAWLTVLAEALILAVGFVLVAVVVRLDVLGLAMGAIVTYSWLGLSKAIPLGVGPVVEQIILVVLVLGAVGLALRRRAAREVNTLRIN